MGKFLSYLVLAVTAIVGLYSVYQINAVADVIETSNQQTKQLRNENHKRAEQILEDIEAGDYEAPDPATEDYWGDDFEKSKEKRQ